MPEPVRRGPSALYGLARKLVTLGGGAVSWAMVLHPAVAQLKPYLAPLLLRKAAAVALPTFLADLVAEVTAAVQTKGAITRSPPTLASVVNVGTMSVQTAVYSETAAPPWAPGSLLQNVNHQLIVVAVQGDLAAVCTSEPALRGRLAKSLTVARPVGRALLEQAFVGAQASVMWLNGVHTPTDSRPNAKTLMGSDLEAALDPLGDQSFYYSAVRSRVPLAIGGASKALVGAAPGAGRIWVNRPGDWTAFLDDLAAVLASLNAPPTASLKFSALAHALPDLTGVNGGYALALVPPELLSDWELPPEQREEAELWAYQATFRVIAGAPGANVGAQVALRGVDLGDVKVDLKVVDDKVKATATWTREPAGHDENRKTCAGHLEDGDWTKIYFDSGHTVSQGRCYQSAYRDQPFPWSFKSFAGYAVETEKPEPYTGVSLPMAIGAKKENGVDDDDSLFAYVLEKYCPDGWLASDDGSMELADFIHISDRDVVTLIHAKAAKSNDPARSVSVSYYEVVVGQAVKNIRHLERKTLADELKRGHGKKIAAATWHNGTRQANRKGIITRAKALPANYERRVVVLQPQLTKAEREYCWSATATPARRIRMRQLDTLMLGARLSCMAVGAKFIGVAAK